MFRLKILLPMATLLLVFTSCKSEYEIQIQSAKKLVEEKSLLVKSMTETGYSILTEDRIEKIQKKIEISAHLSGNKELFLRELTTFRDRLNHDEEVIETLISKYP